MMKEGVNPEFFQDKKKWATQLKKFFGVKRVSEITVD